MILSQSNWWRTESTMTDEKRKIHNDIKKGFFRYPNSTAVNRNLPKNKIYEQAKADTKLKELFVNEVDQILWEHKLSSTTLNIEGDKNIAEIQVFRIQLKGETLNNAVLQAIDKAIPHPIIFEIKTSTNKLTISAAYKEIGQNGGITLSEYYQSDTLLDGSNDDVRANLPTVLNVKALYEQLLVSLLPYELRDNETFPELIARIDEICSLEKKHIQISKKLSTEKQFKKKVSINAELKSIKQQLKILTTEQD